MGAFAVPALAAPADVVPEATLAVAAVARRTLDVTAGIGELRGGGAGGQGPIGADAGAADADAVGRAAAVATLRVGRGRLPRLVF